MTTGYYFVEPLDVLMFRGNKSFGGAGQHGEAVMPPWPSLFAGAFRSALLADDPRILTEFITISTRHGLTGQQRSEQLEALLGTERFAALGAPDQPGAFRIAWLSLALTDLSAANAKSITPIIPLPADLAAFKDEGVPPMMLLKPDILPEGCVTSGPLPLKAMLRIAKQVKPVSGRWLDGAGIRDHLLGKLPNTSFGTDRLYRRETRVGIALNAGSRTVETGALYSTEAVAFCESVGFLIGVEGDHGLLPEQGLLRLGGDGKGARYRRVDFQPPEAPKLKAGDYFRLILTTPGLFTGGWLPEGVSQQRDGSFRLDGSGFSARLICAAVGRHDVISGWDLARWAPKTAQRVAPAGSVYWFDDLQGDPGKLAKWAREGLWGENIDPQRRAEGFNNAWLAAWPHQ